jgi:glycosyltransferase involved in cell wall biosynthesis
MKVLHVIDSLGRGGAETLLVGVIKATPELNHVIVSLKPLNEFSEELTGYKIYFLNVQWYHSLPKIVYQLKQIIVQNKVDVVHAHLFWSIIASRLACPRNTRLINSYHAVLYGQTSGKYPFYARLLDKFTYYNKVITLCVSDEVRKNIKENIGIKQNVYVLHNFIENEFYNNFPLKQKKAGLLKFVAVGNLKKDKNYEVILEAFTKLNVHAKDAICLDIYGKGPLLEDLLNKCREKNISNIHLKGSVRNISEVLLGYDVYIISSTSEGFGLAVIEAMAVGLPAIVSDIPTLREVTGGYALYFDPLSADDLTQKISLLLSGSVDVATLAEQGHAFAKKYTKKSYLKELLHFYSVKAN